jgi:TonB family protein
VGKQRVGEWTAFFPSGKLAAKVVYQADKRVSTLLYREDGSRNTKDTVFERDSEYPGGPSRFLYFLGKNLRYPDSAVVYEIQGTVHVRFHVSKEGKVSNLIVEQSANPYLDAEALRVLALMKDWEPAILAGVPVESFRMQPVVFSLNGN